MNDMARRTWQHSIWVGGIECPGCNGEGVREDRPDGGFLMPPFTEVPCPDCHGTGVVNRRYTP